MKRHRVALIWLGLAGILLVAAFFLIGALSDDDHPASTGSIAEVRAVPGRANWIEIEARAGVCNNREARLYASGISIEATHAREVLISTPSPALEPDQYCLGEEIAVIRRLKLPQPASEFVFYEAGSSPPERIPFTAAP